MDPHPVCRWERKGKPGADTPRLYPSYLPAGRLPRLCNNNQQSDKNVFSVRCANVPSGNLIRADLGIFKRYPGDDWDAKSWGNLHSGIEKRTGN